MRSVVIGLRLWGIALEPFWPARKGSSTSRTSVRCRWRISVAKRSSPAPASAIAESSSAWRSRGTTWVETGSPSRPSPSSTRASKSGPSEAYVPTAPEIAPVAACSKARSRRSALRWASSAKPASLSPKLVGSAWTPWVRPTHSVSACALACSASAAASARAPARIGSPARLSCSASAVSSTSEDVSPKWIQRPAGPADAASTSTKAATSWSVTRSRSCTASTVNVEARIASRSSAVGPSSASAAATSTSRQASILAWSVQTAPSSGRV